MARRLPPRLHNKKGSPRASLFYAGVDPDAHGLMTTTPVSRIITPTSAAWLAPYPLSAPKPQLPRSSGLYLALRWPWHRQGAIAARVLQLCRGFGRPRPRQISNNQLCHHATSRGRIVCTPSNAPPNSILNKCVQDSSKPISRPTARPTARRFCHLPLLFARYRTHAHPSPS